MKSKKNLGRSLTAVLIAVMMIASVLVVMPSVVGQDYTLILDLTISDTARVVDHDDGIYVVGTSGGDLYVINEAGDYTVTNLGVGQINDVRIENGFIAVAAYQAVMELELTGLTPVELWRTTSSEWYKVVSTDLSEDGSYVTYFAQRYPPYVNSGEIGVLGGGAGGGSLISNVYTSGYRPTNWWLDATGDMEYIAASHPTYPPTYRVGVGLYHFDGSTLTFQWWTFLVAQYDVTEVRISENKDYVAAATSSGIYMDLLRLTDGAILWSHETPGKEQYACDGDDNLNYVIGATQAWSPPYPWFILKNLGESGYEVITQGQMNGAINDIDSTPDCSYFAFGSDAGEVVLFKRTGDTVETVFTIDGLNLVDAIELGSKTLLVGGNQFIHLYAYLTIDIYIDIKPGSCPNPINLGSKGVLPVAVLGTEDFDVTTIDPDTIQLTRGGVEGYVEPLRWNYEDVATPYEGELCGCHELNGDGYMDLSLKFKKQDVIDVLDLDLVAGETIPLIITGYLKEEYDGTPIKGQDCVWVLLPLLHDVGVTEIISPTSGTAQTFTPEVTVENFGTKKEKNVPVNMVITTQTAKFLEEDFEANDGGYTVTGDVWEWGTPLYGPSAAHSGSYCWGTDLDYHYPNNANAKLDSSPITLSIGATLKFWHWYSIETSWDGCNVKISTDGGTSWTVITPIGDYTGTANSANPLYPEPIFTGTGQQYWEEETFDLAAYEGMTVKFRFDFGSDGSVYYPGYFIDDVSIYETVEITDYDETVYIDIDVGESMNVVFPDWTPEALAYGISGCIDYEVTACTQLDTDTNPANDCKTETITLCYFHDVGVTEILSPTSGPSQTFIPEVTVENFGQFDESDVPVYLGIGVSLVLLDEDFESGIPGDWTIVDGGDTTDTWMWDGSSSALCDSDGASSSATLDEELISPVIDCSALTTVILEYDHTFNGGSGIYANQGDVYVWNGYTNNWDLVKTYPQGTYASGVETIDISFVAGRPDLQIKFHFQDFGLWGYWWQIGYVEVYQPGETIFEYYEIKDIDIDAGGTMNVIFPDWTPLGIGEYIVTACTQLATDTNPANDCQTETITLDY